MNSLMTDQDVVDTFLPDALFGGQVSIVKPMMYNWKAKAVPLQIIGIYPSRIGFRFSEPDFDTNPPTCPYRKARSGGTASLARRRKNHRKTKF